MTAAQNATKIQQLLKAEIKSLTAERDALLQAFYEAPGYVLAEYETFDERDYLALANAIVYDTLKGARQARTRGFQHTPQVYALVPVVTA